jgi:hypothetical protein
MSKKGHDAVYERLLSVLNPPSVTVLYEEAWRGDRIGDDADKVTVKLLKVRGWDDEGYEYTLRWVDSAIWTVLGDWKESRELVDKKSDSEAVRFVQKLFARLIEAHPAQQWVVGAVVVEEEGEGERRYKDMAGRVVAMSEDADGRPLVHICFTPEQTEVLPRVKAQWQFRVVTKEEELSVDEWEHVAWLIREGYVPEGYVPEPEI